jgi:hypothetical protein
VIGYYFDILLRKVPEDKKAGLQRQYDDYLRMIDEQYIDFRKHADDSLNESEQQIMDEFEEAESEKESKANAIYEKQQNFLKSQKK